MKPLPGFYPVVAARKESNCRTESGPLMQNYYTLLRESSFSLSTSHYFTNTVLYPSLHYIRVHYATDANLMQDQYKELELALEHMIVHVNVLCT